MTWWWTNMFRCVKRTQMIHQWNNEWKHYVAFLIVVWDFTCNYVRNHISYLSLKHAIAMRCWPSKHILRNLFNWTMKMCSASWNDKKSWLSFTSFVLEYEFWVKHAKKVVTRKNFCLIYIHRETLLCLMLRYELV